MYIRKAIALNRKLFKKDPIKWKSNLTDTLQRFCMMNYVQPFSPDQDIVTVSESTLQLYQNLYDEDPDVYAEKLASFCFSYAEYLSSEPDFVWETEMGIHLTLDTEKNVPDAPEQAIPSNLTISSEYEEYDIKRIRKATALMRYGVILYERSVANDQLACAPALVEAYYCTARLLAYFLSLLEDGEEYDIQQICRRLYADIYCYYQKALSLHLSHMRALAEKHPKIISGKRKPQPNSSPSEQELLNLENAAYTSNPLMECYNFAVKLACNDYTEEAHQLHTGLYNFFREKPLAGDPDLQLANLIIYARNAEDADAALACLHRFDVVGHKQKLRSKTLFHYHYLIADIYLKKSDFSQADHYFAEAYSLKKYAFCDLFAFYHGWAVCRKNLEDPAKAEDLILEGLEAMMGMEPPPTAQWNMLCREYIAILHLLGKASEAAEWLKEILPEE